MPSGGYQSPLERTIGLPVFGSVVNPGWRCPERAPPFWAPSEYGARFAYGHIVERGRHMIVSGGLGTSQVPLRLGMPPEIVRVTLGA